MEGTIACLPSIPNQFLLEAEYFHSNLSLSIQKYKRSIQNNSMFAFLVGALVAILLEPSIVKLKKRRRKKITIDNKLRKLFL